MHDRGGAIIARAGYDRIDVWMGYGDAGLTRALNWGMRMMDGTIYPNGGNLQDNLDYSWIPTSRGGSLQIKNTSAPVITKKTFYKGLGKNSEGSEVKVLQEKLAELGYFKTEATGKYGTQTIEAVFAFQKDQKILNSWNDYGAGYFGAKTMQTLNKIIAQKEQEKDEEKSNLVVVNNEKVEDTKLLIAVGLGKDAEGEDVEELQKILQELGYYNGEIDGIYNLATINAVLEFQKDYSVIGSEDDYGAGFFGPKTKKALEKAVAEKESELEFGKILDQTEFKTTNMVVAFTDRKEAVAQMKTQVFATIPKEEKMLISMTLKKGDQGESVKELQKILKEAGYLKIQQETNFFGALTEKALIQYQIDQGIVPSAKNAGAGIVGPMTRKSLNAFANHLISA